MILSALADIVLNTACPHTRGDDPIDAVPQTVAVILSPYAWG